MSTDLRIPLFPLHTVLFPESPLPLKIFEPRYTDMISDCLKNDKRFGVCLIREGNEIGEAARTYEVGTFAHIHDWHMRNDGFLGLTVIGGERFKIVDEHVERNQLLVASVETVNEQGETFGIPRHLHNLIDLVDELMSNTPNYAEYFKYRRTEDASWVGFRLCELLPLRLAQKQYFLQLVDPVQRLERLSDALEHMELKLS